MSQARSFRQIARSGNASFSALFEELRGREQLLALVRSNLPPHLAGHCVAVRQKDRTITLYADDPAWATQLRFCSNEMLKRIRAQLPEGPDRAQVRIIKDRGYAHHRARRHAKLSAEAAKILRQAAMAISDPQLRAALRRLASHGE